MSAHASQAFGRSPFSHLSHPNPNPNITLTLILTLTSPNFNSNPTLTLTLRRVTKVRKWTRAQAFSIAHCTDLEGLPKRHRFNAEL